jgi:hypothetical protein
MERKLSILLILSFAGIEVLCDFAAGGVEIPLEKGQRVVNDFLWDQQKRVSWVIDEID